MLYSCMIVGFGGEALWRRRQRQRFVGQLDELGARIEVVKVDGKIVEGIVEGKPEEVRRPDRAVVRGAR